MKHRIANEKRAEHPSQLHIREAVVFLDRLPGDGKIHPIEIGDSADEKHPAHEKPAQLPVYHFMYQWAHNGQSIYSGGTQRHPDEKE